MSAYRFGLLRWPAFRMNKAVLPKHRNLKDSCDDGADKQDTCGSKQDNSHSCDDRSDKQDTCGSKQDSSSTTEGQATSDSGFNNPSAPKAYDSRKYGHNLPMDSVLPNFETLPCIPTGIFRCTAGEVLGAGAGKKSKYKNPEYFSFHHMTFYDMHLVLRSYREACPDTGRKK